MESKGEQRLEGIASIALLPGGSISGHFIQLPHSVCYGLHGSELCCDRECSRGEDYRLIKLSIIDFSSKKERVAVVECRGHDAARFQSIESAHGWEEDVIGTFEKEHGNKKISISFECETLKADAAAEEHLQKYMPNLVGLDAVDGRQVVDIIPPGPNFLFQKATQLSGARSTTELIARRVGLPGRGLLYQKQEKPHPSPF